MSIVNFDNRAAYEAAAVPTDETRLALIDDENKVEVDAINVTTREPEDGDALFYDEDKNLYALKGGACLNSSLVPSDWTLIGYLFNRQGNQMYVLNKAESALKYAAYVEYSITAISATDITINLRLSNNYDTNTAVSVTLDSTDLNATNAAAIQSAIEAKITEVSATNTVWAYYDETNNKIVIVTTWNDYRQYVVGGSGCTISLTIWDDMPANGNAGWRVNDCTAGPRIMNAARGVAYYSTNGVTPTADVALNANANPVKKDAFENSEYCAALRAAYGTYYDYMVAEYYLQFPQKLGVFGIGTGKELTDAYGNRTVQLADGTTDYAFKALHYGLTVGYSGVEGFEAGDWWLSGAEDGTYYMRDDVYAKIRASQSKLGTAVLNNGAHRWFAQRYDVYYAWFFNGASGGLNSYGVYNAYTVQAVSLLNINNLK